MTVQRKISVIMSVYNGEKYLRQAVQSILTQTYADFEFIIINDGSTDGSRELLEGFKDDRIRLFNDENKGQTKSLNEAIRHSTGKYIARMDADDIALPQRFEKQIYVMESDSDVAMCGSFADVVDGGGRYIRTYRVPVSNSSIRRNILMHNPFIHSSVMIRKDVLDAVGYYDESFNRAQDYELWTRIVFKYTTVNIPEILIKYRIHDDQMTSSFGIKMRMEGIKSRLLGIGRAINQMRIQEEGTISV